MDHFSEGRTYSAGDDVLVRVTVEHEFHFERVEAMFQHVDFDPTLEGRSEATHLITLVGDEVKLEDPLDDSPMGQTSTVVLRGLLTAEKALGEYRCLRMETEYRGGRRIPFNLKHSPTISFHVVEESVASPKVTAIEVL